MACSEHTLADRLTSTHYYSFHGSIYNNCKRKRKDHTLYLNGTEQIGIKKKQLNKEYEFQMEKCHWLTMAYGLKIIPINLCLHFFKNRTRIPHGHDVK